MIGFNFSPRSPRRVAPEKVQAILREAPKGFQRVGVFQDASPTEVAEIVRSVGLHWVQLHGSEDPAAYRVAGVPILKAFGIASPRDLERAAQSSADWVLLDSRSDVGGGSGQSFEWNWVQAFPKPFLLAGGLDPDNVGDAILRVKPWGVDVASGVEQSPGKKDRNKIKAFVNAARAAESQLLAPLRGRSL